MWSGSGVMVRWAFDQNICGSELFSALRSLILPVKKWFSFFLFFVFLTITSFLKSVIRYLAVVWPRWQWIATWNIWACFLRFLFRTCISEKLRKSDCRLFSLWENPSIFLLLVQYHSMYEERYLVEVLISARVYQQRFKSPACNPPNVATFTSVDWKSTSSFNRLNRALYKQ